MINQRLPNKILFGSSYSYRLLENYWDTELLNVGLAGFSFIEGLTIKKHFNIPADTLLIEANVLSRNPNRKFVESYTIQFRRFILRHLYLSRTKYQPVGVFGNPVISPVTGRILYKVKLTLQDLLLNFTPDQQNPSDSLLQFEAKQSIQTEKKDIWPLTKSDSLIITRHADMISTYAQEHLDETILFIEIPMSASHEQSEKMKFIRSITSDLSNQHSNISNIPAPDYSEYSTSDGSHLDRGSAIKFVNYLERELSDRGQSDE